MTCPHGNGVFDCTACADARNRRRRARGLIVALAAFAEPAPREPADADPLAGPFGDELVDMIQSAPPDMVARLREQLRGDAGALRVIDAALARRRGPA